MLFTIAIYSVLWGFGTVLFDIFGQSKHHNRIMYFRGI